MTDRELDALFAEKVLEIEHGRVGEKYVIKVEGACGTIGCKKKHLVDMPAYCTDIAAAMQGVAKLGQWHGFEFMLTREGPCLWRPERGEVWMAGWVEHDQAGFEWRAAGEDRDNPARAIVLAALDAVGVKVP